MIKKYNLYKLSLFIIRSVIDFVRKTFVKLNGIKKVMVLVVDEEATLELRINLNIQRAKTLNDLIKELRFKISTITKKQGRKKVYRPLNFWTKRG